MHNLSQQNALQHQQQYQHQKSLVAPNKLNILPQAHGNQQYLYQQQQQQQQAVLASVQAKNMKNRNFTSPLPFTGVSTVQQKFDSKQHGPGYDYC